MLIDFGLLYLFRLLIESKDNRDPKRREDEEGDFCDYRINFVFGSESLCLR